MDIQDFSGELSEEQLALLELMLAEEQLLTEDNAAQIQARPETARIPLAYAQARVWFLEQMYGSTGANNIHAAFRLDISLRPELLEEAVNHIWRRHEILRTRFAEVDGVPYQFVQPYAETPLLLTDLRSLQGAGQAEALQALLAQEAGFRFDLGQDELARLHLIRLAPAGNVISLTMHHIVADGWSVNLFLGELLGAYQALAAGTAPQLPELQRQYGDFAYWQHQARAEQSYQEQLAYWRRQLAPPLAQVELPTVAERSEKPQFRGHQILLDIPEAVAARLGQLCRAQGATLFMGLLGTFKLLLSRLTGARDIIVGTPVSGRSQVELEPLIGYFVNTLALRTQLTGDLSFRQLLDRVKQTCLDGIAHQDIPFEQLVAHLNPPRRFGRNPYFQILFNMLNYEQNFNPNGDLEIAWLSRTELNAQFDITVYAEETSSGIGLTVVYDCELFTRAQLETFLDDYLQLLRQVVAAPDQLVLTASGEPVLPAPIMLDDPADAPLATGPRTATERALAQIWQDLLGAPPSNIYEDFFAAGGHSLLAVRLFSQIRQQLNVALRLAVIYDYRTIAELAGLIDQHNTTQAAEPRYHALVKINEGSPQFQPFYCVHGAGGHVMFLNEWREYLPAVPLYGFQARGYEDISEAHQSIESMARTYVAELRRQQPEGPYYLGGYSGGGVVAYEMAQQLHRSGQDVALLALIDTFHPTVRPRSIGLFERLLDAVKDPVHHLRKFMRVQIAWRLAQYGHKREKNRGRETLPQAHLEVYMFNHFDRLWSQYDAQPYAGPVVLLRAAEEWKIFDHVDESKGWAATVKTLRICEVPGDHRTVISQPNLPVMLQVLQAELSSAQPDAGLLAPPHPGPHPLSTCGSPA